MLELSSGAGGGGYAPSHPPASQEAAPPKGASSGLDLVVEILETSEVLDPGFHVHARADLPLATKWIQVSIGSWIQDPPAQDAFCTNEDQLDIGTI